VSLLESCLAEVPTVIGHFRPVILMPVGMLAGLSPAQIESILLHELGHIQRHDYLVNSLQRCIEGLLFYHPAAWWISSVIRTEREHCCDDLAVSISGDPHEYARALAALEQNRFSPAAVAATGGSLVKRIHRLLYPRSSGAWAPFVAVLILVLTAVATVAAWPVKPSQSNVEANQQNTVRPLGPLNPYYKWLNEDAACIIDQAERTAFLRLTNNEERDKFIVQFWERRNPTPGAPNKFKEEHYRRLAYANEHFASGVAGWNTDRGHIYILYGPPDELEVHPHRTEVWLYHHVKGVGDNGAITFVDSTGQGDFRLSPSPWPMGKQP
jgi:GWxTD domain-containing protein